LSHFFIYMSRLFNLSCQKRLPWVHIRLRDWQNGLRPNTYYSGLDIQHENGTRKNLEIWLVVVKYEIKIDAAEIRVLRLSRSATCRGRLRNENTDLNLEWKEFYSRTTSDSRLAHNLLMWKPTYSWYHGKTAAHWLKWNVPTCIWAEECRGTSQTVLQPTSCVVVQCNTWYMLLLFVAHSSSVYVVPYAVRKVFPTTSQHVTKQLCACWFSTFSCL